MSKSRSGSESNSEVLDALSVGELSSSGSSSSSSQHATKRKRKDASSESSSTQKKMKKKKQRTAEPPNVVNQRTGTPRRAVPRPFCNLTCSPSCPSSCCAPSKETSYFIFLTKYWSRSQEDRVTFGERDRQAQGRDQEASQEEENWIEDHHGQAPHLPVS